MVPKTRIQTAREFCAANAWTELLAFADGWRAESPAEAKASFYRGAALAALGRYLEAEVMYREALDKDPRDFKAWHNLAGILFESMSRPVDAICCMEQAMKLEPHNKLGWANLASMLGQLGRHEKALEFANRALALDPQMVEAHLHKGAAAKALGKTEIVKEVSEALASIEAVRFKRAGG